jgi:hypothetical protein
MQKKNKSRCHIERTHTSAYQIIAEAFLPIEGSKWCISQHGNTEFRRIEASDARVFKATSSFLKNMSC